MGSKFQQRLSAHDCLIKEPGERIDHGSSELGERRVQLRGNIRIAMSMGD
jgi:hypothetical protein